MKSLCLNRKVLGFALASMLAGLFAGCARTPSGSTPVDVREMSFRIDFNGSINDNYYYYIPIDTIGDGLGPVPVFPSSTTADAWVTGAATHFVQYHAGQYYVYRITSLQPFTYEPLGAPLRTTLPNGGSSLAFTIDLNTISATGDTVDVNIITNDQPLLEFRLIDGLGPLGTDFLNIDIQSDRTYTNNDSLIPEGPNDVLNQDRIIQPPNDQTKPLDIVNWTITVNT